MLCSLRSYFFEVETSLFGPLHKKVINVFFPEQTVFIWLFFRRAGICLFSHLLLTLKGSWSYADPYHMRLNPCKRHRKQASLLLQEMRELGPVLGTPSFTVGKDAVQNPYAVWGVPDEAKPFLSSPTLSIGGYTGHTTNKDAHVCSSFMHLLQVSLQVSLCPGITEAEWPSYCHFWLSDAGKGQATSLRENDP